MMLNVLWVMSALLALLQAAYPGKEHQWHVIINLAILVFLSFLIGVRVGVNGGM